MTLRSCCSSLSIVTLGFALHAIPSHADVFSWNNITYAPTPTVAQQVTSLGNGGGTNSVSVQFVLNNGASFITAVQSPTVDSYNTNGTYYTSGGNANAATRYLQVGADMVNSTNGIGSITVNLFFAKPVTSATFSFFDVDINATGGSPYVDQIRNITGTTAGGATVYLASLTGGTANTVTGTGSTYAVTATGNNVNNLAAANATATFGSDTAISEISFTYGDNYTSTGTHGTAQIIGLSDLNFTSVPEPGTLVMISLGVAGVAGIAARRRR